MRRVLTYTILCLTILGVMLGIRTCAKESRTKPSPPASAAFSVKGELDIQNAFVDAAEKVGRSVVTISTERTHKVSYGRPRRRSKGLGFKGPFGEDEDPIEKFFEDFFGGMPEREFKQRGLGSGFIIDSEGHILTNHHVIEGADEISIALADGRSFIGSVKGVDPRSDLAVIKINAKKLPVTELGNSDLVKAGEWVVALGNPFGHILKSPEPTVTVGVISALHRRIPTAGGERGYLDMLQTDAAINPGNSGGPLCNLEGKVIGINVAIFSTSGGYQGVGFAIPINAAKNILEELKEGKEISYGWLGVSIQEITPEIAEYFNLPDRKGMLVSEVLAGSPAEKAGMKCGDIIKVIDGKPINTMQDLLRVVSGTSVGQKVRVDVIRDRMRTSTDVVIGKRPSRAQLEEGEYLSGRETVEKWRGISVVEITDDIAAQLGLTDKGGVAITDVEMGSPAHEADLLPGDVIREINKNRIMNISDYKKITKEARGLTLIRTERGYFTIKDGKQ